MRDHSYWEAKFLVQKGWPHKTGSTACYSMTTTLKNIQMWINFDWGSNKSDNDLFILTALDLDFCVFCSYLSWILCPNTSLKILQADWLNFCDHDMSNFQYGISWHFICNDWNDWHMSLSSTGVIIGLSHTQ